MEDAWIAQRLKEYITARIHRDERVPPPRADITQWYAEQVELVRRRSTERTGERLAALFDLFADGPTGARRPTPTGIVAFSADTARPQVVPARSVFAADGCFNRAMLRDEVLVEPGLHAALAMRTREAIHATACDLPDDHHASFVGKPGQFGVPNQAIEGTEAVLLLRLSRRIEGALDSISFHLELPPALLRAMLSATWWRLPAKGGAEWVASPPCCFDGEAGAAAGPALVQILPLPNGCLSTVWRIDSLVFQKAESLAGLTDVRTTSLALNALRGDLPPSPGCEAWLRIPVRRVDPGMAEAIGGLRTNVGIVEAVEARDLSLTPLHDGLAWRIEDLVRVEAIHAEGGPSFVEMSEAVDPLRAVFPDPATWGYVVGDDTVLLLPDRASRTPEALERPIRLHALVLARARDGKATDAKVTGLLDPLDVRVASVVPIRPREPALSDRAVRAPGTNGPAAAQSGRQWLWARLLGNDRAVSAGDIRSLVRSRWAVGEVRVEARLGRDREGRLASITHVECALDPTMPLGEAEREELRMAIAGFLARRASPHLRFEVSLTSGARSDRASAGP